jgi:transcription elongation factor GreA-like protein/transcription elongation GreA/GreB family factor
MEYFKQFKTHIANNDLPSIVSLWEEYCLSDEIDPEESMAILNAVRDTPLANSFGLYVDQLFPLWELLPDNEMKHDLFRLLIDCQTSNSPAIAERVSLYLQSLFGSDPEFASKMRLVGLREKEQFQGAVSNFELLNHLHKNNFVFHKGGWGVGEIMDVSFIREEISLEFEYVAGLKDISFKNGFNTLIPLKKDHFLSRRFGSPDLLEKELKQDPIAGLKLLLKDLGPKTAAEIKDELCELVIPEEDWAKWWQNARAKLKKDTMIEPARTLSDSFSLRKSEVSHHDQLKKILDTKPSVSNLIEIVYSFVRDFPAALKKIEAKSLLVLHLSEILKEEISIAERLQIHFILEDLNGGEKNSNVEELIQKVSSFEALIDSIDILAFKKRALIDIAENRKDWQNIFLDLLLANVQNPIRDFLFSELMKKGFASLVSSKLEELLSRPHEKATAFLWYFAKIMERSDIPFSDQNGKDKFLETFFVLMYILEQKRDQKEMLKKMHNFLTAGRFATVRSIFQGSSIEVVREILLLSSKCHSLEEHDVKILHSLAEVSHPDLSLIPEADLSDTDVIWTTEEGLLKVKEKLHHIGTVETVINAKEIEVARAHGDLRENSEFKFALEKRGQLQAEIKQLSEMLNRMRTITEQDIDLSAVSVGTVVTLQNKSGEKITYTLLGPWDVDPDKNILSSQSKVAQTLMGAKLGESKKLQNDVWTVKEIKSYLNS